MHRGAASERGDVVLGWLTRVVVILALFALAAFDAIAVASARFSITDDANAAAEVANSTWNQMNGNVQAAYDAAAGYADQHNETIVRGSFSVAPTGAVYLTLHGHATTLVMSHLGPLKKLVDTTGKGSATTPSN
ncbi:MAG: hypothetical protein ACJ735_06115 [Actinomycetes bacterium]